VFQRMLLFVTSPVIFFQWCYQWHNFYVVCYQCHDFCLGGEGEKLRCCLDEVFIMIYGGRGKRGTLVAPCFLLFL